MTIIDRLFNNKPQDNDDDNGIPDDMEISQEVIRRRIPRERVEGRIIKLGEGWGFISSKSIPYTRIFFHWSALSQDTLRFLDLRRGMMVEFEPIEIEGKGYRAIRIKVTEEDE